MKDLAKLPVLRSIGVASNEITDAGLLEVAGMRKMVSVGISGGVAGSFSGKLTRGGFEKLWQQRPDLLMANGAGIWAARSQCDFFGSSAPMVPVRDRPGFANLVQDRSNIFTLSIDFAQLTDDEMADIARFEKLTHLHFNRTVNLEAASWKLLSALSRLRALVVKESPLDADSVKAISDFKELRTLRLPKCNVTDAGAVHLAKLDKLTGLDLSGAKISDASLPAIARMKNLVYLSLSGTQITDHDVKRLVDLENLAYLTLNHTKIGDAGIEHLVKSKSLRTLELVGTSMSEDDLATLAKSRTLVTAELPRDKLSIEAIREFWKSRSDAR